MAVHLFVINTILVVFAVNHVTTVERYSNGFPKRDYNYLRLNNRQIEPHFESREYSPHRRPRRSYRRERRYPVDRKREAWADQHALGQAVYMTSGLGLYEGDDDYLGQEDSARPSRRESDYRYRGRTSNRRRRQREPNFDDYLDKRPWMRARRSNRINNYSNLQMILNNGTHNIRIKDRDHKLAKDVKIYEESLSDVMNSLPADELDIQPTNGGAGIKNVRSPKRNKPGRATRSASLSKRVARINGYGGRPSYSRRYFGARPSYDYQDDYLSNYYKTGFYGFRRKGINNYANNPGISSRAPKQRETRADTKAEIAAREAMGMLP